MHIRPYVTEHQCLFYATLVQEVVAGLEHVENEGMLPDYYQQVFNEAAQLCYDVVISAHCAVTDRDTPCSLEMSNIGEAAMWFSSLTRSHPETYKRFTTYDDIDGIGLTLEHLAKDDSLPNSYPKEWIVAIHEFFLALWGAVVKEFEKDGLTISDEKFVIFFPPVSRRLQ